MSNQVMSNVCWRTIFIVVLFAFVAWPIILMAEEGTDSHWGILSVFTSSAVFVMGWLSHRLLQPRITLSGVLLWLVTPLVLGFLVACGRSAVHEETVILYFASAYLRATSTPVKNRLIPGSSKEWWWLFFLLTLLAVIGGGGYLVFSNMQSWMPYKRV